VVLVFGDVELDPARYDLRRAGTRVHVEPQVFEVLTYLATHYDRVVTNEELMDQVWGDRFVSDTAIKSRIKQARRAIGDDGTTQRIIRTVHGRGYRFMLVPSTHDPDESGVAGASGPESPIRYALSDGLNIAYQVTGAGETDIVLVAGFVSHLELDWQHPAHAQFLHGLGSFGRLIRFDKRGTGLSDRPADLPDLETRMHDVLSVMAAAQSRRAVLFGYSEGGPLATLFAAAHPDRVEALILYGTYARRLQGPGYPWGHTPAERERYAERLAGEWSWEADLQSMCPSADDELAKWWGRRARASATPSTIRALILMNSKIDVRDVLPSVRVPTLVMHRSGDRDSRVEEGRYVAEHIPGARFVELSGVDHFVAVHSRQIVDQVAAFLGDHRPVTLPATALMAVLVLTGRDAQRAARELGGSDARPGRTSDGRPAVAFDGPATAIRAGLRFLDRSPNAEVGMGLHIAEVERTGVFIDGAGVSHAVDLATRAPVREIWLSTTVRDLIADSDLRVEPSGEEANDGRAQAFRVI
jgi:pimeloyl-ACP methyl ester carboxylesterase